MSKQLKVTIAVVAVILAALVIWIITLLTGGDGQETTPEPAPIPSVTASAEPSTSPEPEPSEAPTPGPSPEPAPTSEEPQPEPTSEPTETPEQSFLAAGLATFDNFTVEVFAYDEDTAPEVIDGKIGFEAEICVIKALNAGTDTRVSTEPWTLAASSDETRRPVEGIYDPAFPPESDVAEGDCVRGWLTFDEFEAEQLDWATLIYANGLGDRALWNFH